MLSVKEVNISSSMFGVSDKKPNDLNAPITRILVKNIQLVLRVGTAVAFVLATTFLLKHLVPVNATTAGFLYLVAILSIATKGGFVEATIASVAAMLCFNFFFLPPVGTLTIANPQNWVALFAFLATSLTANQLSARVKRRAVEAEERRREVERLYALSRALLLIDISQPIARQIVRQISLSGQCWKYTRDRGSVSLEHPELLALVSRLSRRRLSVSV